MPRGLPRVKLVAKRLATHSSTSASAGSGPNTGLIVLTQGISEKKRRDRLIQRAETHPAWALGFADEVWWSRLAQPQLHSWVPGDQSLRLVETATARSDLEPTALACYGLLLRATATTPAQMWLRFTRGQPVSGITVQFLAWCSDHLAMLGKQALLLIWDNASWHCSQEVQHWLRTHNQRVKQTR